MARRDDISPFIDDDFDSYVENMRRPHMWGDEPELSVAPDVLQRPVRVFDTAANPISWYEPTAEGTRGRVLLSLLFHRAGHYDLLVPQEEEAQSKL